MATHSSILAWTIPWTEEPSRLQSMGLQRVGHNSNNHRVITRQPLSSPAAPLTLVWTETTLLSPREGLEGQISSKSSRRVREMRKGSQAMDVTASRKRQGNNSPWLLLLLPSRFSCARLCATP